MKKVLYFSTTWCGPCKTFKPVVQQVSQETGIPVTYLDADQDQEMADAQTAAEAEALSEFIEKV